MRGWYGELQRYCKKTSNAIVLKLEEGAQKPYSMWNCSTYIKIQELAIFWPILVWTTCHVCPFGMGDFCRHARHVPIIYQSTMCAVRVFVMKTQSGHSRHTHTYTHVTNTGIFPSCFDALRWAVRLGWVVWSCQWEWCYFVFVCLSPALSHTHTHWFIILLYTLTCSCFLPLFSWQCTPHKWNLAHLQKLLTNPSMLPEYWGLLIYWWLY